MGGSPDNIVGGSPPNQEGSGADIKIVEPSGEDVALNPSVVRAEFFASGSSKVDELNRLTDQAFERSPSLGQFLYYAPTDQKYQFTFSGFKEPGVPRYMAESGPISGKIMPGGRIALDRPVIRQNPDGTTDVVDIIDQEAIFPTQVIVVKGIEVPPPEPTSEPHAALLNPKRKMRLSE